MLSEQEIPIGPSEWQMWRNLPTTIAVFEALQAERSVWVQRLAFGETLTTQALKDTAMSVGTIAGLTVILEDLELALQQQWAEAQAKKIEEETEGEESE